MFETAKLKIDRANHHIKDLEGQFAKFLAENPHSLRTEIKEAGVLFIFAEFRNELPNEIALIIGDAIHNARSAIDHMVWELVGIDHGTQDRYLKCPTGDSRTSFEASCNGIKTPSASMKALLKSLELFPYGKGHLLYVLNTLDNVDSRF